MEYTPAPDKELEEVEVDEDYDSTWYKLSGPIGEDFDPSQDFDSSRLTCITPASTTCAATCVMPTPAPSATVEDMRDIKDLGWRECPVGSLLSVRSGMGSPAAAATEAPSPIPICAIATGSVEADPPVQICVLVDTTLLSDGEDVMPTIVVIGDQSSVLESLPGISLPRGQGISTCVSLVLRLQDDSSMDSRKLLLECSNGHVETTNEANIAEVSSIYRGHASWLPGGLPAYKVDMMNQCLGDLGGASVVQRAPEVFEEMAKHISEILWPPPLHISNQVLLYWQHRPWPPRTELQLVSCDAGLRPLPWPSFNMVEGNSVTDHSG